MECPKCGAVNPDGAEFCNLCHLSFFERVEAPVVALTSGAKAPTRPERKQASKPLGPSAALASRGGLIAISAGGLFLLFLGLFQAIGLPIFKFLWLGVMINKPALSYFLLITGLFTMISGAVAGNLADQKNIVPVVRLLAGLTGVAIWVGLILGLKPAAQTFAAWLASGIGGMVAGVAAFPITGLCLGLVEAFGDEWDAGLMLRQGIGGLVAGGAVALVATLAFTAVSLFGEEMPIGWGAVVFFSFKLGIGTLLFGFLAGFSFWLAMARAERIS